MSDLLFRAARLFVAGTDTDVGKTRFTAGLALAIGAVATRTATARPRIVKPVQTGVRDDEPGDAATAARIAGCEYDEFLRFRKPADPWNAALAEDREPPTVADLAARVDALAGPLVIEGAGGIAVPLNERETFADFARAVDAPAIVVVALRLGCINHARLTLAFLAAAGVRVAGIVLNERRESSDPTYRADVERALASHAHILGTLAYEPDDDRGARVAARLFARV